MQIDPQLFGRMQAELETLQKTCDQQTKDIRAVYEKLDAISVTLSEAKGGWRTLMWLAGCAGTMGAGLSWVLNHMTMR